jgi:hypothetical protein
MLMRTHHSKFNTKQLTYISSFPCPNYIKGSKVYAEPGKTHSKLFKTNPNTCLLNALLTVNQGMRIDGRMEKHQQMDV